MRNLLRLAGASPRALIPPKPHHPIASVRHPSREGGRRTRAAGRAGDARAHNHGGWQTTCPQRPSLADKKPLPYWLDGGTERCEPRHAVAEVAALFAARPAVDPRLRLLMEVAAELRAGQAVRAKRSDLVLDPVGGFGLGRFIVHGRGKKHGEVVDLHPELRALVDDELSSGYLRDVEAAYRDGTIKDYFLFPAGRLKRGRALVKWATKQPLGSTGIRDMFRKLEKAAGVDHQEGRAFYGLRRQATDLAPEFEQDARVLNRLSGHLNSATRERVYQDPQNEVVGARAAQARRRMRLHLGERLVA